MDNHTHAKCKYWSVALNGWKKRNVVYVERVFLCSDITFFLLHLIFRSFFFSSFRLQYFSGGICIMVMRMSNGVVNIVRFPVCYFYFCRLVSSTINTNQK